MALKGYLLFSKGLPAKSLFRWFSIVFAEDQVDNFVLNEKNPNPSNELGFL